MARIGDLGVYAGEECAFSFAFEWITVSVGSLEEPAVLVGDALNDSGSGLYVKAPGGSDGHPSDMGSGLLAGGNDRLDQIPGGETGMPFLTGQISPGKPEGVESCPPVGSPASCRDPENRTVRIQDMIDESYARRIDGVGLREAEPDPVELGPAPGSLLDGKSGCSKPFEQNPPGGVDGRRLFQRGPGPGEDPVQNLRLLRQKRLNRTISLLLVADPAGESQVGDPVRSAPASGVNVIDLQGDIFCPAVGAGPAPFFEEVLPDLVACQGSLLVFHSGDFRVFDLLYIEPDQLLTYSGHRNEPPEAFDPRGGGVHPVSQGGWKPSLGSPPVVEAGLAVAERRSSPSPKGPALVQVLFDLRPPVMDLGRMEDVDALFSVLGLLPDHNEAGGLRPGIDLDPDGLRVSPDPIFQPDGERGETMDHGPTFPQKLPGPGRVTGHQGLFFLSSTKTCIRRSP